MDGTPPTGRTVFYPVASFAQIEGDKIRSQRVYVDMHNLFEQLGLRCNDLCSGGILTLVGLAISFAMPALAQQQNTVDPEVRQQIEAAPS
jgi:hypothetical protein